MKAKIFRDFATTELACFAEAIESGLQNTELIRRNETLVEFVLNDKNFRFGGFETYGLQGNVWWSRGTDGYPQPWHDKDSLCREHSSSDPDHLWYFMLYTISEDKGELAPYNIPFPRPVPGRKPFSEKVAAWEIQSDGDGEYVRWDYNFRRGIQGIQVDIDLFLSSLKETLMTGMPISF